MILLSCVAMHSKLKYDVYHDDTNFVVVPLPQLFINS